MGIKKTSTPYPIKLAAIFIFLVMARIPELTTIPIVYYAGIMTIISYIFSRRAKNDYPLKEYPEIVCLVIIVTLMYFSIPFSLWIGQSFKFVSVDFPKILVIVYIMMKSASSLKGLRALAKAFSISGIVLSLLIFFSGSTAEAWRTYFGYTLDANDTALMLVITLPFSAFCYQTSSRYFRLFWLFCLIAVCIAITTTGSRGGFLGFLVVTIMLLINYGGKNIFRNFIMFTLIFGALSVYAPEEFMGRVISIKDYQSDVTSLNRMDVWRKGIGFMFDNPVFGVGVTCFPLAEGMTHEDVGGKWFNAHNSLLQIGAEIGLGGLVCIILIYYFIFKRLKNISQKPLLDDETGTIISGLADACRISLIGFLISSFFLSQAYFPAFYYLIGLSLAVSAVHKNIQYRAQTKIAI